MKQPLALRFDRIVKDNLPKRMEMLNVLKDGAFSAEIFWKKGNGVKSVLEHMGRLSDFKGIYAFIENDKFIYIDESSYVIRRLIRHYKGNSKYQMKLAHLMVNTNKEMQPFYTISDAIKVMENMRIVFIDVPDELERQLTTLYLQCQFECKYNRFE